jgi:hypothetical protein
VANVSREEDGGSARLAGSPARGSVHERGDRRNERNERFFVDLSGATNAAVSDAQGQAMIVDND